MAGGVAVFSGTAGTVRLGDDILFQGMDFTVDGYTIAGAGAFALHPVGTATITTESGVGTTFGANCRHRWVEQGWYRDSCSLGSKYVWRWNDGERRSVER